MPAKRYYRGADIPMRVIRRYARQVAEKFRPEKIILFGSRAYGTPHEDSDVDLLVVMPARNNVAQAVRIGNALEAPFPMDLLVRTPAEWAWRLADGDMFIGQIAMRGKVLYEAVHPGMGQKGRGRLPACHPHILRLKARS
jgi:predicted nucleotidyltransferase